MWQHWSRCNLGHIKLIWVSHHTNAQTAQGEEEMSSLRSRQASQSQWMHHCICAHEWFFNRDTQVCVCDRWCDLPNPHPFRSSHPLYPGGKRREPCKGISLYSSMPALPFLFSLCPKHHSCWAYRERGKKLVLTCIAKTSRKKEWDTE